jgi:hypothetical protein
LAATSIMWSRTVLVTRASLIIALAMLLSPFLLARAPQADSQATGLAMKYLRSIDKSASFLLSGNQGKDFVFVGRSLSPSHGWRLIVINNSAQPHIVWDSRTLVDPYFDVTGLSSIDIRADEGAGYLVTIRGCVPHQCADGKIGFAIYAGRTRQKYIAHILTNSDGSYSVKYYPSVSMPAVYRDELNEMMCSDNGISRPLLLPIKCE